MLVMVNFDSGLNTQEECRVLPQSILCFDFRETGSPRNF